MHNTSFDTELPPPHTTHSNASCSSKESFLCRHTLFLASRQALRTTLLSAVWAAYLHKPCAWCKASTCTPTLQVAPDLIVARRSNPPRWFSLLSATTNTCVIEDSRHYRIHQSGKRASGFCGAHSQVGGMPKGNTARIMTNQYAKTCISTAEGTSLRPSRAAQPLEHV